MNDEIKLCINCEEDAYKNCYSDAGIREVGLSGLCEKCFDIICADDEEEI